MVRLGVKCENRNCVELIRLIFSILTGLDVFLVYSLGVTFMAKVLQIAHLFSQHYQKLTVKRISTF